MELKCWGMVTFALCLAALLSQVLGLNSRPLIKRQSNFIIVTSPYLSPNWFHILLTSLPLGGDCSIGR